MSEQNAVAQFKSLPSWHEIGHKRLTVGVAVIPRAVESDRFLGFEREEDLSHGMTELRRRGIP